MKSGDLLVKRYYAEQIYLYFWEKAIIYQRPWFEWKEYCEKAYLN